MASSYQLDVRQYEIALRQWVDEVIRGGLWKKYADLHIDVLDSQFRRSGHWVEASLLLLNYLTDIVDESHYETLLAIPLESTVPISTKELRLDTLEQYMGMTPPSFYLFPLDSTVLKETLFSALYLPTLEAENKWRIYFKEGEKAEDYYGTVFVMPYRPR